jgi:hypothetical protein
MPNDKFVSLVSDHIINKVHEFEEFYFEDAISGFDYKKHNLELTAQQIVLLSMNNSEDTLKYLLAKGIIETGKDSRKHKLTNFGREVKAQRGYENYISFIQKRDKSFLDTATWTRWIAIFTAGTLAMLIITEIRTCTHENRRINDTTNKANTSKLLDTSK